MFLGSWLILAFPGLFGLAGLQTDDCWKCWSRPASNKGRCDMEFEAAAGRFFFCSTDGSGCGLQLCIYHTVAVLVVHCALKSNLGCAKYPRSSGLTQVPGMPPEARYLALAGAGSVSRPLGKPGDPAGRREAEPSAFGSSVPSHGI